MFLRSVRSREALVRSLIGACLAAATVSIAVVAPAAAATTASLSPASGPPGSSVTVSGSGFDASARVDVFLDLTDITAAFSNASGAVSIGVQIPKSAQPGTHWISLDEVHANRGAQAQFTVFANWAQGGYGPSGRSFNPLENTVDPSNADQLAVAWSQHVTSYGNVKPFVVLRDKTYVFDEGGVVSAFSPTGSKLWVATGGPFSQQQASPAANGGSIFVGNTNGIVRSFPYLCRTDGGLCTTIQWQASIGAQVNGLTFRAGLLYASGQDGKVHVINSFTGALGSSITPPFYTGAVTQPVAFAADGSIYIAQGTQLSEISAFGVNNGQVYGGTVSTPAVGNTDGYLTTADGNLNQAFGWATAIGAAGCAVPPAFAKGVVYAASCSTIGAYDAETGATLWSVTVPGPPTGLAVANGVLYACWNYRVRAYATSNGGRLGSGGWCNGTPEIVDGTLFSVGNGRIYAATLDGAVGTVAVRRPDIGSLRPGARVLRHPMH